MKKSFAILLAGALLLAACGKVEQATLTIAQATRKPASSATPKPTSSPTLEPTVTSTPEPQNSPTPEPVYSYDIESVSITAEDGLNLSGNFFHTEGDTAVLFVHMAGPNDQKNWIPFANEVAQRGFSALTFDLRCYGESDCRGGTEPGWIPLSRDMQAAINFLREKGFKRIVCVGASMGGRACITVAFDEELAGLIIVSGTASDDPEKKDLNKMVNPGMPKLFVVSESDPTVNRVADMNRLYESAPDPKVFHTFPGTAHGTEFFKAQYGGALSRLIFDFLYNIRDTSQAPAP
ncbi:MAG: alpha/beta fold hydrolase [Anaerolineales bacterium]|nr:alpha/beta fold hydrolase [Anaerolineales bacterium]